MKNKAYYYKKDVVKRSKMYGTTTYKLTVYGIKSGKLYRVGETEYNSSSTCGEWGEASGSANHPAIICQQPGSRQIMK